MMIGRTLRFKLSRSDCWQVKPNASVIPGRLSFRTQ
jgi:hypothetical protein